MEKLTKHLKEYCEFEKLAEYMSDENKMKEYLLNEFNLIFEPLFITGDKFKFLLGKDNLNYGAAHLWSYRFNKRIGQYLFPKEIAQNLIVKAIKQFFFNRTERAKYFDMTDVLSKKKQPIIFKRGLLEELQSDKDFENPQIIIPEDILFPTELRPKNYNSFDELLESLKKAENNVTNKAETEELSTFFEYFAQKFQTLLEVDVIGYQPKVEILKLFPPILLDKSWLYLYRFIANLVPDRPAGGFFIRVKNRLNEKQLQDLQFICNFVYGKIATKELELIKEEYTKAFETFENKFSYTS